MQPTRRQWKRYRQAEERIRESVMERANGNPAHTYPARESDLRLMHHYHARYGMPEPGLRAWAARWWAWLTPRGGGE